LGRCNAPHHRVELAAISGANASLFGLIDEIGQPTLRKGLI